MTSDRRSPVAIIGGGFSGSMVAAQLARRGIESVLLEGGDRSGRGVAYSTTEAAHVLNVRAESMSAWPDDPEHFSHVFGSEGGDPRAFAERRFFGRYLQSILDEAIGSGRVTLIKQKAIAVDPSGDGWTIRLRDGTVLE